MGALIQAKDWTSTSLGAPDYWPQCQKTAVQIMLASGHAMQLAWGPELTVFHNDAYVAMFGDESSSIGRRFSEASTDMWNAVEPHVARVFAGETIRAEDMPLIVTRRGFEDNWWSFSCSPVRDEAGTVAGLLSVIRDATGRIRAERAEALVRKSEERLKTVLDGIGEAFYVLDRDWRFLFASQSAIRSWGKRPEDVLGQSFFDCFPQAVGSKPYEAHQRVMETGVPERIEALSAVLNLWIELDVSPSAAGGVSVAFRDVDARKRADIALRESELRLETLVQGIPQIVWRSLDGGRWTWASPQWERYTGLTVANSVDRGWLAALHFDDRKAAREMGNRASEKDGFEIEYRLKNHADGTFRWFKTRAAPVRDDAGKIIEWLGTSTDIHELRELQARQEQLVSALHEADRQKDEFLAMLAHELRNPLASIGNAGGLLDRMIGPGPQTDPVVALLKRQTKQLARLVDDLMDISRIARGRITLDEVPVDIREVVDRAVDTVQAVMGEKNHHFVVTKPEIPVYVRGDLVRLTQAINNVLHNAAKYTDAHGEIRLEVWDLPEEVHIEVTDNGSGIPAELLPHVFDLFVQSERTLDRSQGGLGIGLSVVKRLIELQHGTVSVESSGPGHGSTFAIRLPRIEAPGKTESPIVPTQGASKRVLVVDDNVDAADSLAMLLQLDNHDVHTVYTAEDALKAAEQLHPEIILLDIGLPAMDGFEVARRIRSGDTQPRPRLVALTGYGRQEDKDRARKSGFDDHVVKPVSPDALEMLFAVPAAGGDGESRSQV